MVYRQSENPVWHKIEFGFGLAAPIADSESSCIVRVTIGLIAVDIVRDHGISSSALAQLAGHESGFGLPGRHPAR